MSLCEEEKLGTRKGGNPNAKYCIYCFKEGNFLKNMTLNARLQRVLVVRGITS